MSAIVRPVFLFMLTIICAAPVMADPPDPRLAVTPALMKIFQEIDQKYPQTSQVILVEDAVSRIDDALVASFHKAGTSWNEAMVPALAKIGRNGLALPGEKREGDGKTPQGIYPVGFAFGYGPNIHARIPYRQMTPDDVWVDDPESPDYNRLVKRNSTRARSFEDMVLADHRYKYGLVIAYNMDPVIPGIGSAIFMHVWYDAKTPTSGCIAMSEQDILRILRWLDPEKKPLIIIGMKRK